LIGTDGFVAALREPCPQLEVQQAGRCDQDMVGITNSAPVRMPVGQRLVMVFNLV
jgi:hypothetical protein